MLSFAAKGYRNPNAIPLRSGPRMWDWLIVFLMWYIAFMAFDQTFDMRLSMMQSSDLIECIFTGKFFDFYGYVLEKASAGGYLGGTELTTVAYYNIVVYLTMAVWTIPLYLLNLVFHFAKYELLLNLWGRVLVILLSVISSILITKLSRKLIKDPAKSAWTGYFFLSSPIMTYCVIIQDQYDIFSVFWTLLALFFYFDKKLYKFSAQMSIAFCCKLFPVLAFTPLILLAEKRISRLIQYVGIFLLPYLATTLVFSVFDSGYTQSQNNIAGTYSFFSRTYAAQATGGSSNISYLYISLILISVIAYYVRPAADKLPALAFLLSSASLTAFFFFVSFHAQWFIIIIPFLTLLIFSMKNFRLGVLLEIAISGVYLLISYMRSFGVNTMRDSIFLEATSDSFVLPNDFNWLDRAYQADPSVLVPIFSIFVGLLCSLLFIAYLDFRAGKDGINPFDYEIKIERSMLYIRTLSILLFMVPPLVIYFSHPIG